MALQSGFYNAIEIDGVYDRVYSADEYTNFYSAFIKDGVRRSGEDDFKVTASGLNLTVAAGYAICGSKWIHNDAAFTDLPAIVPPVGDYSRIDAVFIHVDTNEATRAASLILRQGTAGSNPQPPAKDTTTGVFELCLCYINVAPSAESVTITDKRGDSAVCGWITTPVGADDFFEIYDEEMTTFINEGEAAFNEWFENVRDTLASVTLFKQYSWYFKTTAAETNNVTFSIEQYDPTGVDIVNVYINGMREQPGVDYTLTGSTITFTIPKVAGTEIVVIVYKSIDGSGLGSVSDEITELQNEVGAMADDYEFNYVCNGNDDNIQIMAKVRDMIANSNDFDNIRVNVIGNFGVEILNLPGTATIFDFRDRSNYPTIVDDLGHRKFIFDFSKCGCIDLTLPSGVNNGFFSWQVANASLIVENLSLKLRGNFNGVVEPTQGTRQTYINCRFWHYGKTNNIGGAYIAGSGTFINCRGVVVGGVCFYTSFAGSGILRVVGGEYYALKKTTGSSNSADGYIINVTNPRPVFVSGVSCPTGTKTGFTQEGAIKDDSNSSTVHALYNGIITALAITQSGQTVNGTIPQSAPIETESFE
jgi:hypothetical protein